MASQQDDTRAVAPEPGQILIVIHDFFARSSDELSLSKGDRIELLERDDEFGDGWYLGRHLINGNSGLFPEVYTRIAPRGSLLYPSASSSKPSFTPASKQSNTSTVKSQPALTRENDISAILQPAARVSTSQIPSKLGLEETNISLSNSAGPKVSETTIQSKETVAVTNAKNLRQDCPVMNETLSVINEHITDLKSPCLGMTDENCHVFGDSGSEYSNPVDPNESYVHGQETDEEDGQDLLTHEQVSTWTSEEVAEYLYSNGVESKHCEIIRDQEITGEVLLGMDQSTIFLKELDFGSIGRRLKTWQKIKSVQDKVNDDFSSKRSTLHYNPEYEEDSGRNRSHSTNSTNTFPRMSHVDNRHAPLNPRLTHKSSLRNEIPRVVSNSTSKISPNISHSDGVRNSTAHRNMHQSLQSFSNPMSTISFSGSPVDKKKSLSTPREHAHRKKGSFDSNWNMQSLISPFNSDQPNLSPSTYTSKGLPIRDSLEVLNGKKASVSSLEIFDHGFFASSETETGKRNSGRKRDSIGMHLTTHSRRSSNIEEQDLRSSPVHKMHTRLGSVESIRDVMAQSAAAKYYGLANTNNQHRTPSETSISGSSRTYFAKDNNSSVSHTLTKHECESARTLEIRIDKDDSPSYMKPASNARFGLRAISSAVTGHEKSRYMGQPPDPPPKNFPKQSPSATSSSALSGGPSLDLHSPDPASINSFSTSNSNSRIKKKSKKETSAYTRGLEKKKPLEAILSADYSGWMRKKSTNIMSTWKPRLFILKGRRLSYYYSENDESEKGLIDISFHRVLPADNDLLTGLYATLTGATHTPGNLTTNNTVAATEPPETQSIQNKGNDSIFIFKLVPPKTGLQRGVNFTKPTVHYFAVPNVKQGRLWMAALMKATIERDDSVVLKSTYQQKTISLTKARAMRHRPPALMNLNEQTESDVSKTPETDLSEMDISSVVYNSTLQKGDSGLSELPISETLRRVSVQRGDISDRNLSRNETSQPSTA